MNLSESRPTFKMRIWSYRLITWSLVWIQICHASLDFRLVTPTAAWSPRSQPQIYLVVEAFDYQLNGTSQIVRAKSWILYAGGADPFYNTIFNDVWVTSNNGVDWTSVLLSSSNQTFQTQSWSTCCRDLTRQMTYIIPQDPNDFNSNQTSLWRSSNPAFWTPVITQPSQLFPHRSGGSCWVDLDSRIHYMGGLNSTAAVVGQFQGYQDLWISADQGQSWSSQTLEINLVPRSNPQLAIHRNNSVLGVDIIYILGGNTGNVTTMVTLPDDLWASGDGGITWRAICDSKCLPWNTIVSNDSISFQTQALYVHTNGIIIVSVQGQWLDSQGVPNSRSDVWSSLDGGWTWHLCRANVSYGPRQSPSMFVDSAENLYLLGGFTYGSDYTPYNDVWVSSIPLEPVELFAQACGAIVPYCGLGLTNWKGPCVEASSPNMRLQLILPSVIIPLVLILVIWIICARCRRSRNSNPSSPLDGDLDPRGESGLPPYKPELELSQELNPH